MYTGLRPIYTKHKNLHKSVFFIELLQEMKCTSVKEVQKQPKTHLVLVSHRCLIKWLEVRKVCPLCNMPVLQLAQQASSTEPPAPIQQPLPGIENLV